MKEFKRFVKLGSDPKPMRFAGRPYLDATMIETKSTPLIGVNKTSFSMLNLRKGNKAVFTLVQFEKYALVIGWRLVK